MGRVCGRLHNLYVVFERFLNSLKSFACNTQIFFIFFLSILHEQRASLVHFNPKDARKQKLILTEGPLFGNLKTLIFEHFSEM